MSAHLRCLRPHYGPAHAAAPTAPSPARAAAPGPTAEAAHSARAAAATAVTVTDSAPAHATLAPQPAHTALTAADAAQPTVTAATVTAAAAALAAAAPSADCATSGPGDKWVRCGAGVALCRHRVRLHLQQRTAAARVACRDRRMPRGSIAWHGAARPPRRPGPRALGRCQSRAAAAAATERRPGAARRGHSGARGATAARHAARRVGGGATPLPSPPFERGCREHGRPADGATPPLRPFPRPTRRARARRRRRRRRGRR